MKYKIEKNIPAPVKGRAKYGFLDVMQPGDSVFIECSGGSDRVNLRNAIYTMARRNKGMKYISRKEIKDDKSGIRVWRTK